MGKEEDNRMKTIRKSMPADLPVILQLRDEARQTMRANGNGSQWPDGIPVCSKFEQDIEQGYSYMVENDGLPVATFALIAGLDLTYARIYDGAWLDDSQPYFVIHRMAACQNSHGIFSCIIDYCSRQTRNLRVDTHRDNTIMQHLLLKHGFSYCGIIHLLNGEERLAYQRLTE